MNQPSVATNFKFEWRIYGGEIAGDEGDENIVDIDEIIKIEKQQNHTY